MPSSLLIKSVIKKMMPTPVRDMLVEMGRLAPLPLEDKTIHGYEIAADADPRPRINLVVPTLNPDQVFGGISTALDLFFELGNSLGCESRIVVDALGENFPTDKIYSRAKKSGLAAEKISIEQRVAECPKVNVRKGDIFITYTWWNSMNIMSLLEQQAKVFSIELRPYLYLIQDYEPHFYPFSSTQMYALYPLSSARRYWAIFNTANLYKYFLRQGHEAERAFVFEPKLSRDLTPFLGGDEPNKARRILVYGRPTVPRNSFPAIEKGLRAWSDRYPGAGNWEVVSAGISHAPIQLGGGRVLTSVGKLSLESYGEMLRTTAVGLSLMISPHPSYPPLEMTAFGVRTITNRYTDKDWSRSHENIISVDDILPDTLAGALIKACDEFEATPGLGWAKREVSEDFIAPGPFPVIGELGEALRDIWR